MNRRALHELFGKKAARICLYAGFEIFRTALSARKFLNLSKIIFLKNANLLKFLSDFGNVASALQLLSLMKSLDIILCYFDEDQFLIRLIRIDSQQANHLEHLFVKKKLLKTTFVKETCFRL